MYVSEWSFVEQFKKNIHVRESRLTLYTKNSPEGDRFRVWRGVELGDGCEKTAHYASKNELVHDVQGVQGTQTQLKKEKKDTKILDPGHAGQDGQENST